MIAFVHVGLAESSGQLGYPLTDFFAFHNRFPLNFFARRITNNIGLAK
jgi:hypothetical protein